MKTENIDWIDGLKGVAILGVILIHCGGASLPFPLSNVGDAGKYGVQLFFLISGYLAFLSYANHNKIHVTGGGERASKSGNYLSWYLKKALRLIPLYYLTLVLFLIFTHGNAYWLGEDKVISFPNVLTHILFLHGFFPHYIDSIIGVEWYIGVLVMFYAITPVLFKIINNIDRAFLLVICSIILCRFLSYGTSKLLMTIFGNRNDAYLYTNIVYFSLITQFPVLTMGVLYYYITKLPAKNQTLTASYRKDKSLLAFSILFFSIALICGLMLHKVNIIFISEPVIYGLAFFLLMFSLRMQPVFIFNNKILRFLGKYSYPIYLLHFLMIYLFNKLFKSDEHTILLRLCFVLITTSLISYILQKYFDKPCYSKLKQLCS